MSFAVLMIAAVLAAGPAAAPEAAQTPTDVAPADVKGEKLVYGIVEGKDVPKTKKVCFKDPTLGSRIPTRRCMDRDAFYERQRETRAYIDRFQREVGLPQ